MTRGRTKERETAAPASVNEDGLQPDEQEQQAVKQSRSRSTKRKKGSGFPVGGNSKHHSSSRSTLAGSNRQQSPPADLAQSEGVE